MDAVHGHLRSLHGVRIWISGAVPPDVTEQQRNSILEFVRRFASKVFQAGGHIIHGSHPSFTPALLAEASNYSNNGGRKDCLTLAVSKFWSNDASAVPIWQWRDVCTVYETPAATGDAARDGSLHILRQWLSERCDAFVAVGGAWWKENAGRAGVPLESGLAIERGVPCFLLGGLGGAAQDYVKSHPEVIRSLRNGLDENANIDLATENNVGDVVDLVFDQLSRLPLVRGRVSDGISFRILALDGGGIKGAFTASVIATLEQSLGLSVVDHFDMVVGTSTGGIIAIGLGMGLKARTLLEFYRDRGTTIFPVTRLHQRWKNKAKHFFKPKYSQTVLLNELRKAYFRDNIQKVLGEAQYRFRAVHELL